MPLPDHFRPPPVKPLLTSLFLLFRERDWGEGAFDDGAEEVERGFLAGEEAELKGSLANEHLHAGDDRAATRAGFFDQQRVFRRVNRIDDC